MRLRSRIVIAAVGTMTIVFLLASGVVVRFVDADQRADLDRRLRTEATVFDGVLVRMEDSDVARSLLRDLDVGQVARVLLPSGEERLRLGSGPDDLGRPDGLGYATVMTEDGPWRTYTTAIPAALRAQLRPVQRRAVVQVAAPLAPVDETIRTLRRRLLWLGAVSLAILWVVASGVVTAALTSLTRLRQTAERVAESGDLAVRVPDAGPSEVRELAGSINTMLTRIEEAAAGREAALEASRAFAADAAHELRTPLASIAANLEILADNPSLEDAERTQIISEVTQQQSRLAATLDALQLLARSDLAPPPTEIVDLADLVSIAAEAARQRHRHLTAAVVAPDEPVEVVGWADGIRVLVDNLIDNAARHGRGNDGTATVTITLARRPAGWAMTVDDDGGGIAPRDRDRVIRRFERGTTSAPGTGLGLAIAAQQARLHGSELAIGTSPAGGARFEVVLQPRS